MSLRDIAHADTIEIMNDPDVGGDLCTITSPVGLSESFRVMSNDIHLSIDPGTGETVMGRQSSVAVLISELIDAGFNGIRGVADSSSKPWLVDIADVNGIAGQFKVTEHHPDNTAGLMILVLELYS